MPFGKGFDSPRLQFCEAKLEQWRSRKWKVEQEAAKPSSCSLRSTFYCSTFFFLKSLAHERNSAQLKTHIDFDAASVQSYKNPMPNARFTSAVLVFFTFLSFARAQTAATQPAPENVPTTWIDADTGHRITRLTTEPGSDSFYFNYN